MLGRNVARAGRTAFALIGLLLTSCKAYDAALLTGPSGADSTDPPPAPYIKTCGNGRVDAEESCDTAIAQGEEGACPAECPKDEPCLRYALAGNGCRAECVSVSIEKALSGDGCCPAGVRAQDDSDCGICGDEVVGPAETCDPPERCPTTDACVPRHACLVATLGGSATTCTAACRRDPLEACQDGDGCCPAGCDAASDDDCSASCGNGVVEPDEGESCEPGDAAQPCPESCDDGDACSEDLATGSPVNCNRECTHIEITAAIDGDGCCPSGENAVNDSDCPPVCGNEVVEDGETCDPCPSDCDDDNPCTLDDTSGDPADCTLVCSHTSITAPAGGDACCPPGANANTDADCIPLCGNGVTEGLETCDPCPVSCSDSDACTTDQVSGSAANCTQICTNTPITQPLSGDGCCPAGQSAGTDSDCAAVCGNGIEEGAETCDPCPSTCSDGNACTTDAQSGSAAGCDLVCSHTTITAASNGDGCCPSGANATTDNDCNSVCGNNIKEGAEKCDPCPGTCSDGNACTTDSSSGSAGACSLVCSHTTITSATNGDGCCPGGANATTDNDCSPVCGNGVTEAGEDCDGQAYCSACNQVFATSIVRRYRFSGTGTTATDSIGSAHGTVKNDTLDGDGKVTLTGGTSEAYIDLPNSIMSGLTNATFEAWVNWTNTSTDHVRIFDFGNSGAAGEGAQGGSGSSTGYLYLSGGHDTSRHPRVSFSRDGTNTVLVSASAQFPAVGVNTMNHIAAVFDDTNNTLTLYLNGAQVATGALGASDHLSTVTYTNNWLGRSQFTQDDEFAGSFYEFRIYNSALSSAQIQSSFNAGPDP